MFPGANATIYRNDAGEPIGWDTPSDEPDPDPYDYDDDRHEAQRDCFIEGLLEWHEVAEGVDLDECHRQMREYSVDDPEPDCQEQP